MASTIARSFLDFLGTVDLPRQRKEDFLVKAASAFVHNEVRLTLSCLFGIGGAMCRATGRV